MRELISVKWSHFETTQIAQSKDFLTQLNCPRSDTLTGRVGSKFDAHLICALFDGDAYVYCYNSILEVWVSSKTSEALETLEKLVRGNKFLLTDEIVKQVRTEYALR